MNWMRAGSMVMIAASLCGAVAFTYSALGNDAMPLEGKKEHLADKDMTRQILMDAFTRLGNEIKADNLERRIEATCALLLAARDTKAVTIAQGLEGQLAGYQAEHRRTTGTDYPVPMCQ